MSDRHRFQYTALTNGTMAFDLDYPRNLRQHQSISGENDIITALILIGGIGIWADMLFLILWFSVFAIVPVAESTLQIQLNIAQSIGIALFQPWPVFCFVLRRCWAQSIMPCGVQYIQPIRKHLVPRPAAGTDRLRHSASLYICRVATKPIGNILCIRIFFAG